jgi:hypothetical protein
VSGVLNEAEVEEMRGLAAQADHAWPSNHAFYMPVPCGEILTKWLYPCAADLLALARSHEVLRAALSFYADEANYNEMSLMLRRRPSDERPAVESDRGRIARAALQAGVDPSPERDSAEAAQGV